jgi:hypothetical protein
MLNMFYMNSRQNMSCDIPRLIMANYAETLEKRSKLNRAVRKNMHVNHIARFDIKTSEDCGKTYNISVVADFRNINTYGLFSMTADKLRSELNIALPNAADTDYVIYIGKKFFTGFDRSEITVFTAHEIAHIANGDVDDEEKLADAHVRRFELQPEAEIEINADAAAIFASSEDMYIRAFRKLLKVTKWSAATAVFKYQREERGFFRSLFGFIHTPRILSKILDDRFGRAVTKYMG